MTDAITNSLQSYGSFSGNEIDLFLSKLKERRVGKGEAILNIGDVCMSLSFIEKGSFIQYHKDEELNEVVSNLFISGEWLLNHASFTGQKPSIDRIDAFEDSSVRTLSIHDVHELIGLYPSFFALGKILEVTDFRSNQKLTPDQKYTQLLAQKPQWIKTFPLKHIASYLGMTPETLSRVRARIS